MKYTLSKDIFLKHKKQLAGYVFWKPDEHNSNIILVMHVYPNKKIRLLLKEVSINSEVSI